MTHRNLLAFTLILMISGLMPFGAVPAAEGDALPPRAEGSRVYEMEEVVVTASRIEAEIREVPRNVTVITAEDIEQATSNYVPDLLARETGVVLKSFFGTDKNAGLDIRGMGETSVSNVLVLVDGYRLNTPDLAGPDFSSIPIDEIERIEIVRGANSVVYGSGAVGGVVNIITKRGTREPSGKAYGSYGSYETFDTRASGGGTFGNWNLSANGSYYETDGYRDNGDLDKKDVGLRARYDATSFVNQDLFQDLSFSLGGSYHEDSQGFPGGVSIDDLDSHNRRKNTDSPEDGSDTNDARLRGGMEADLGELGIFKINGGLRDRNSDYIFGFTPLKPKDDQESRLEEDTLHLDAAYVLDYQHGKTDSTLQLGLDVYDTNYFNERLDQRERKNSSTTTYGLFATYRMRFGKRLTLDLGGRYNIFRGVFRNDELVDFDGVDIWVNGDEFDRNYEDQAYQAGLVYTPAAATSLFANIATSFRIPNVDEYALADADLKPQEGWHADLGWRQQFKKWAESSLTLFYFEIEDEIYYDPNLRLNRNYDDTTQRAGVEVDVRFHPTKTLSLWGNYTLTWARFKEIGNDLPLVPMHLANFGVEWRIIDPFLLALKGTYVDEKYDGSDIDNDTFEKIDAYQVFDLKLTYNWKKIQIFGGVNNIFDELYSTIAFSELYYPMPTRNFYGGVEIQF